MHYNRKVPIEQLMPESWTNFSVVRIGRPAKKVEDLVWFWLHRFLFIHFTLPIFLFKEVLYRDYIN